MFIVCSNEFATLALSLYLSRNSLALSVSLLSSRATKIHRKIDESFIYFIWVLHGRSRVEVLHELMNLCEHLMHAWPSIWRGRLANRVGKSSQFSNVFQHTCQEYWPRKMCRIINSKYLIDFNVCIGRSFFSLLYIWFRSTGQMIRFTSRLNHYQNGFFFCIKGELDIPCKHHSNWLSLDTGCGLFLMLQKKRKIKTNEEKSAKQCIKNGPNF